MAIRNEIVWRSGVVYLTIVILALLIMVRILILQFVERGKWSKLSEKYVYKTAEMPAGHLDL